MKQLLLTATGLILSCLRWRRAAPTHQRPARPVGAMASADLSPCPQTALSPGPSMSAVGVERTSRRRGVKSANDPGAEAGANPNLTGMAGAPFTSAEVA
jgi:hypothetical protein